MAGTITRSAPSPCGQRAPAPSAPLFNRQDSNLAGQFVHCSLQVLFMGNFHGFPLIDQQNIHEPEDVFQTFPSVVRVVVGIKRCSKPRPLHLFK